MLAATIFLGKNTLEDLSEGTFGFSQSVLQQPELRVHLRTDHAIFHCWAHQHYFKLCCRHIRVYEQVQKLCRSIYVSQINMQAQVDQ